MENAKLEDVTSVSVVYTESQTEPFKIGSAFERLWQSNRLVYENLKSLTIDKEKEQKEQREQREQREEQKRERDAWYLAMEERFAGMVASERAENMKQRTADTLKHDNEIKYLKDEIECLKAKNESLEAKYESLATRVLALEAAVRTQREDYRVLIARMQPLFLRVLLDEARHKIARLLGEPCWDDISSNRPPSQLPTWLAQQLPLNESTRTLTPASLDLLSSPNPIRREGNEVAHTATIEEIQEAILSKQQESTRVVLKNLFEFTYDMDLPLTTS